VEPHRFDVTLEAEDGGVFIVVPLDVPTLFGTRRPAVRGAINGVPFRSTIAPYGRRFYLPVNRKLRDRAGVAAGDMVAVELERDDAPREVEVPAELKAALGEDGRARARFEALSYTHRKEYATWVAEATREETRLRRAARAVAMLREGRSTHR
jgi:hypothetical protein